MPRVPVSTGPELRRTALQTPTLRTPDVSSGLQAVGQALGQTAQVMDRRLMERIDIEANTADAEITAGWLQWDAEARRRFQGANIDQYEVEAGQWWDKAREEYGQRLSPAARQRLGQSLARRQAAAAGSVAQHAAAVRDRHADETAEAAAQAAIEFGVDTGNPAGARQDVLAEAARMGARKGWSTEQVQAQQQKWLATLHLVHITRLTEGNDTRPGDPAAAQAYYEAHKGEIPATAQTRVEQVIAGEKLNQEARAKAAEWASLPLGEQLERASGLPPALRERTLTEIRNNNAMVRQAQAERQKAYSDEAWQIVGQTGRLPPQRLLMQLDGRERVQLQDYLRQRAEAAARAAEGRPTRTDPAKLAELLDMAATDPEAFKAVRMQTLVGDLSESDMQRVASLQRDMLQPDRERETATSLQQVIRYTGGMKPERKAEFERTALNAFEEFRQSRGKAPTFEERQVILDRLAFESTSWWSKQRFYQVPPGERANWVRRQVPADERAKIEEALKRRGVAATPENVLDMYIAVQRQ